MTWKKTAVLAIALAGVVSSAARADYGLVTNGGFEQTDQAPGVGGQLGFNINATGWSTTGYNFLFPSGTADTTGVTGSDGNLKLWGPNSGSANGLPASSPDGGNFVAADGDFQVGAITQTINGLTAGNVYTVSFYWAASQQSGFDGDTVQYWSVSLGAETHNTTPYNLPSHGFSGWMPTSINFTADSTSDVLSFLAVGNVPVPPFLLLDGVSLRAVPEPSSIVLSALGVIGLGGVYVRRRRLAKAVAV